MVSETVILLTHLGSGMHIFTSGEFKPLFGWCIHLEKIHVAVGMIIISYHILSYPSPRQSSEFPYKMFPQLKLNNNNKSS